MQSETVTDLLIRNLRMFQSEDGYRHAIDPFLLCLFTPIRPDDAVVDLGTASGVIPLVLARTTAAGRIVGVEIQERLVDQAVRNVRLNRLQDRIEIRQADVRDLPEGQLLRNGSYDVVVANPPYRRKGTGKMSPGEERASCRHEIYGGLNDFLLAAACLLRDKGRLCLIYLPERLPELLAGMAAVKLEPKRIRCVHSHREGPARLVLVEGRKAGRSGMAIEPPLYIYEDDEYSAEIRAYFAASGAAGD